MAKTISQLPDATVVNSSDELVIQQSGVTKRATKTEVLNGIVNANIDSSAAIAGTKISPNFGSQIIENNSGVIFYKQTNNSSNNGITLGSVAKETTSSGGAGTITIQSNNASNPLEGSVSLISDATATNRRLSIGCVEQGVAHRNVVIAELGGNVGIGTSSPAARLHVAGNNAFRISGGSGDYIAAQLANTSGVEMQVFANANINAGLLVVTDHPIDFATNSTTRMRINANGNVGIGTTVPQGGGGDVFLHVYGSVGGSVRVGNATDTMDMFISGSAGFLQTGSNIPMAIRTNSTERMRIKSTGQVRFQPLAADPAGAEAGDVYYNSSSNKLKVYNGSSWVDLH